jgi:hypothetical protein
MTSGLQPSVFKEQPHGFCYDVLNQQFNFGMGKKCIKEI